MQQPWSRNKLKQMLYHGFIGTIADNAIEIGWVFCFSLLADKLVVERITTMFGLNDAFWVILSSTYYTTRTSLTARLPRLLKEKGQSEASKQLKNHIYLFYLMLLPSAFGSYLFLPKLLTILGVQSNDLVLYLPYFRLTILSILVAAPWSVMIPAYLRARGESKIATALDHAIASSMLIGIFITTHLFHKGVSWAMVVNIAANSIPLIWFIVKKPIPQFRTKGFEFSWHDIKESWKIVKWELIRRLAPRVSAIIGASLMITVNPIYLAIKYWVSNLAMFPEGWVDSLASLLNSHVSRNTGIKNTTDSKLVPYKDNEYVFRKSVIGLIASIAFIYVGTVSFLKFLPEQIYLGVINPWIYALLVIEVSAKLRYYMWLSISRSYRHDLNAKAQLFYAVPTAILTPLLIWSFLYLLNLGMIGIFATGAIVGTIQLLLTEIYFRKKLATEV